jgi:uncharacterized membrane protein
MHWGAYEVFSLLSGIVLVIFAMVPGIEVKYRAYTVLGGAGFVAYAFYVAGQTSGVFLFPWVIFVIPPVAVLFLIGFVIAHYRERAEASAGSTGSARPDDQGE